jgi:hypothetical protein
VFRSWSFVGRLWWGAEALRRGELLAGVASPPHAVGRALRSTFCAEQSIAAISSLSLSRRPGRRRAPPLPGKSAPLPLPASPLRLSIPVTRRTTILVAASSRPPSSGGVQSRAAESIGDLGRSSGGSEYPSAGLRPFPLLVLSGLLSVLLLHFFPRVRRLHFISFGRVGVIW